MLDDQELRSVYCDMLLELAEKDDRVVVLEADLMKAMGTGRFKERFPHRSINVGVAEANMIGVAAGLAAYGKVPFANSFATFATRRCFDQIFISAAYSCLNVKICGSDPGVSAEYNGGTHMALEDIGILRTIPGITIFEPVDAAQLRKAMPQIIDHQGPVYIRLYRRPAERIFSEDCSFTLGKAALLKDGKDVTVIASGMMVKSALLAADLLAGDGISVKVLNIHTIKPIDQAAIIDAASETGAVVTVENHNVINGLGSAVAEVLGEYCPVPICRVGVRDHFGEVGKKEELLVKFRLTPADIAAGVRDVLKRKRTARLHGQHA